MPSLVYRNNPRKRTEPFKPQFISIVGAPWAASPVDLGNASASISFGASVSYFSFEDPMSMRVAQMVDGLLV